MLQIRNDGSIGVFGACNLKNETFSPFVGQFRYGNISGQRSPPHSGVQLLPARASVHEHYVGEMPLLT